MDFQDLPKNLSRFGFGKCEKLEPLEKARVMEIVDFIEGRFQHQRNINQKRSSYGLKHKVERAMGSYVANGELIAAMYILDYKVEIDTPNASFNVSESSIKDVDNENENNLKKSKYLPK